MHGPYDDDVCEGAVQYGNGRADGMDITLRPIAPITAHGTELRPNDGMVTVESAKWGLFHGCIPADHLDEVGQGGDEWLATGFDHLAFYRDIAAGLASSDG